MVFIEGEAASELSKSTSSFFTSSIILEFTTFKPMHMESLQFDVNYVVYVSGWVFYNNSKTWDLNYWCIKWSNCDGLIFKIALLQIE